MTPSNEPRENHEADADTERLQALLSEYAAAEARGQNAAALYPTMAALLTVDSRLRAELVALRDSVGSLYDGTEGGGAPGAEPDLSFLRRPTGVGQTEPSEGLGQRVIRFSQSLLDQIRPRQLVRSGQKGRGQRLYHYHVAAEHPGEIELTIEIFAEGEESVTVSVMALDGRRDPFMQGGTPLSLSWGEEYVSGESDATGHALFTAIPAAALPEIVIVASPP